MEPMEPIFRKGGDDAVHGFEVPDRDEDQDNLDNHADQLNPNNDAYWESRGEEERPDDWEDRDR